MTLKLLAFLFISSFMVLAQDVKTAKILDLSKSGKSLSLNLGNADDIKSGQFAVLINKKYDQKKLRDIYLPVVKIRAVKTLGNESIWILVDQYNKKGLEKKSYLFLNEEDILKGRKELNIGNSDLISPRKLLTQDTEKKLKGNDSSEISKRSYTKKEVASPQTKLEVFDQDVELVNVSAWEKYFNDQKPKSIYKSQYIKEFQETKNLATFEKVLFTQLAKWNSSDYQTHSLFDEQKRNKYMDEFQEKHSRDSYFASSMREKKEQYDKLEEFKKRMESNRGWSSDYSDEELSYLVKEYGVQRERSNIDKIINYQYNSQIITSFGINLLDNENLNDPDDTQVLKYDLQLGYEYYAFKKFKNLSKFTFEVDLRRALDAFTTGKFNATSTETSIAGGLNWYPFRSPNLVDANIFYFGFYMRYGLSQVNSTGLNSSGQYQLYSFPGILAGMKYNFNNLWGLRITGAFENIVMDRLEKSDPDGLPDRLSYMDGKIAFGITRFI